MSGHIIRDGAFARGGARATRRARAARRIRTGWLAIVARMAGAVEERRLLATLDDRMLADIGLDRRAAEREAARAPWDLSPHGWGVGRGPG